MHGYSSGFALRMTGRQGRVFERPSILLHTIFIGGNNVDLDEVFKRYQRALKYRRLSQALIVIGIAVSLYQEVNHRVRPLAAAFIFIGAAIAINLIYWKCPVCERRLPLRESHNNFECCPHCGTRLRA